jgi:hypothetical protein
MKIVRIILCTGMILFLLFSPDILALRAQESFVDARFVRKEEPYKGTILLYHVVRHRPYSGSLTLWLNGCAQKYEKKHKGTYIEIEGVSEAELYERLESGRKPDAYSFFSGSLYSDRLQTLSGYDIPLRSGLFMTDHAVPYCYSGYCKLIKTPDAEGGKSYYANDVLAARIGARKNEATEEKADLLYLDWRRAGDLIRYKDGFSLARIEPIDSFTDAVCWLGIERDTDPEKAEAIKGFIAFLLEPEQQQSLNALGVLCVRNDVKDVPPEAALKVIFKKYETVVTVDPFLWYSAYDALSADASLSRDGDENAHTRFTNRLHELYR